MGRGDVKTAKGKRTRGSYGVTRRPNKRRKITFIPVDKTTGTTDKVVSEEKVAVKKAPVKKATTAKKTVAKKTTATKKTTTAKKTVAKKTTATVKKASDKPKEEPKAVVKES